MTAQIRVINFDIGQPIAITDALSFTYAYSGQTFVQNGANLLKVDKLYVGEATKANGAFPGSGLEWLDTLLGTNTVTSASFASTHPQAGTGVVGASRTGDANTGGAIGVMGFCNNNDGVNGQSGWGFYGEAWANAASTGITMVAEYDIVNKFGTTAIDPYNINITSENEALRLASGGSRSGVNPASAAATIFANGSTFDKGIVFQNGALTSATGVAIALPGTYQVAWYTAANTKGGILNGNTSTGGVDVNIINETTGAAFSTYVPVITSGSGLFTTVSATGRSRKFGKLIFFQISITITTNGTAATSVIATIPTGTAAAYYTSAGRANTSAKMVQGLIAVGGSTLSIVNYDNTYPGSNGEFITISGFYESS